MTVDTSPQLSEAQIREFIEKGELFALRRQLLELDALEVARLIDELPAELDVVVFRLLPREEAAETFQLMDADKQRILMEELATKQQLLANLLNDLNPDDRTALLEEMPAAVAQRLLRMLEPENRAIATRLLGYPDESIGRLMTTDFVAVQPDFTIRQTLEHIRIFGKDSETLNVIYVTDENWKLLDDLRVREILLADPDERIEDLMDEKFVALKAADDQESAIRVFRDYDRVALPVTDSRGILLGIVTVDDVMDVAEEEATEDFHRFGSMAAGVLNPLKSRVLEIYRKRVFWLSVLVFMNVFSGAAIASFEETIAAMVSLVFFLPLLIDSGGNAGAQSATLVIRALATGEVELRHWLKLMGRELVVALLLGVTMALAVALIASFRAPEIILIVSFTMVSIVITGSLIGLTLPFIFMRFGVDPATASAPLITSLADITGVIIYFSMATWLLG